MSDDIERILIQRPGFYHDIEPREYFREPCPAPAFTNSLCAILNDETPFDAAYVHPAIGQPAEETASTVAKRLGDVTHQLTLGKGRGYAVGDFPTWGSNAAKSFKELAEAAGMTPVKKHEYEAAENMAAILKPLIARALVAIGRERGKEPPEGGWPYDTEVVIAWQEDVDIGDGEVVTIWCRGMIDIWCPLLWVALDPKITAYLTDKRAPAHIGNLGWDTQKAFYTRGIVNLVPEAANRVTFADLMVKPKPPHTHRVVATDKAWEATSTMDIERAMVTFARCLKAGEWPGYGDGIHYMAQPTWAAKQALERAMEEEASDDGGT